MISSPPDAAAAQEAELRSEDDGMPEHPAKAADAARYADTQVERECNAAAGYPVHPVARAVVDAGNALSTMSNYVRPPRNTSITMVAGALGLGLAVFLLRRSSRPALRRFSSRAW